MRNSKSFSQLKRTHQVTINHQQVLVNFQYHSPPPRVRSLDINSDLNEKSFRSSMIQEEGKIRQETRQKKKQLRTKKSHTFYQTEQRQLKHPILDAYEQFHEKIFKLREGSSKKNVKLKISYSNKSKKPQVFKRKSQIGDIKQKFEKLQRLLKKGETKRIAITLLPKKKDRSSLVLLSRRKRNKTKIESPKLSRRKGRGIELHSSASTKGKRSLRNSFQKNKRNSWKHSQRESQMRKKENKAKQIYLYDRKQRVNRERRVNKLTKDYQ